MIWASLLADQGGVLDGALKGAAKGAIMGAVGGGLVGLVFVVKRLLQKNKQKDGEDKSSAEEKN
jgi:Na+/glutamate symporter